MALIIDMTELTVRITCKNCGAPLTKGNIKVIRPKGKKRPFRVCRTCPQERSEAIHPTVSETIQNDHVERTANDTGTVVQRPQDSTGGPLASEVVFTYSEPTRYRFFMLPDQTERIKLALGKPRPRGFGIGFEVIPVPDYQVDQEPDRFADMVEVMVKWKDE